MNTPNTFGWLAVAAMVLGLSGQGITAEDSTGTKAAQTPEYPVPVVQPESLAADRPVIRVSEEKQAVSAPKQPLYQPPRRGAPGGRVGGGTRGPESELPLMYALVPDHAGMSSEVQPRFVWYLSKSSPHPLEFTLIDAAGGVTPIIEERLSAAAEPGIHIIELSQFGRKLERGKSYLWFVSLVADPERRSKDVLAGGLIEVGELPSSVAADVAKAEPLEAGRLLAQAGFWYDAMGILSDGIRSNPSDQALHELRAALLDEVDLNEVAAVDRQQGL